MGFLHPVPLPQRKRTEEMMREMQVALHRWLPGQLISMILLAVSTWIMLLVLGVPNAWVLGVFNGLLTFVPYLGPIVALIPILLVAFVESPTLALCAFTPISQAPITITAQSG